MCEDCRIAALERKREQFMPTRWRLLKRGGYASKSKKVYRDRFEAARKDLKQAIERYARARKQGRVASWLGGRLERNGWYPTRYRRARAEAKLHGAI